MTPRLFGLALAIGTVAATAAPQPGEEAFKSRCSMCHGEDGRGNPAIARLMKVTFKPMSSDYIQTKSDDEIRQIVTRGKGKMVPVRGLTADQIGQIIGYLRTFKAKN